MQSKEHEILLLMYYLKRFLLFDEKATLRSVCESADLLLKSTSSPMQATSICPTISQTSPRPSAENYAVSMIPTSDSTNSLWDLLWRTAWPV